MCCSVWQVLSVICVKCYLFQGMWNVFGGMWPVDCVKSVGCVPRTVYTLIGWEVVLVFYQVRGNMSYVCCVELQASGIVSQVYRVVFQVCLVACQVSRIWAKCAVLYDKWIVYEWHSPHKHTAHLVYSCTFWRKLTNGTPYMPHGTHNTCHLTHITHATSQTHHLLLVTHASGHNWWQVIS